METKGEVNTDLSGAFTAGHTSGEAARPGVDQKGEHDPASTHLPTAIHHATVHHFDLQEDHLA